MEKNFNVKKMKSSSDTFYIYALYDPVIGEKYLYYIGQTKESLRKRLNHHCHYARKFRQNGIGRNPEKQNWVFSILERNDRPSILLLDKCYDQKNADEKERFWIKFCRDIGHPLLNKSTGGFSGGRFCLSEEAKRNNLITLLIELKFIKLGIERQIEVGNIPKNIIKGVETVD